MLKNLKHRWDKRLEPQVETLLRLDRKITVRECSLSKEINQNQSIGYKSSIFQLQISSNLYVSPMRYVGNITNPVVSDTYSIAFLLIQKSFWPCPLVPCSFEILQQPLLLPLNWVKASCHSFERHMVLSLPNYLHVSFHVAPSPCHQGQPQLAHFPTTISVFISTVRHS